MLKQIRPPPGMEVVAGARTVPPRPRWRERPGRSGKVADDPEPAETTMKLIMKHRLPIFSARQPERFDTLIHLALGFSTALAVVLLARETIRLENQAPRIAAVLDGTQQDSPTATPGLVVNTNRPAGGAAQPAATVPTSS